MSLLGYLGCCVFPLLQFCRDVLDVQIFTRIISGWRMVGVSGSGFFCLGFFCFFCFVLVWGFCPFPPSQSTYSYPSDFLLFDYISHPCSLKEACINITRKTFCSFGLPDKLGSCFNFPNM